MRQKHNAFDVKAVMVTAQKYSRLEAKIAAYDWLIKSVSDIVKVREYIAKRTAFEREALKLKKRLDAVSI